MNSSISMHCLDEDVLQRLAAGDCVPSELKACEEHVSICDHCRDRLNSEALDAVWAEQLLPALHTVQDDEVGTAHKNTLHHSVLNLLGPTDDPHMLGRIGNYEVVGLVGIGGMGVVFKAFDAALNRFVAIKMMQPHLAVSGAARQRFEREGRAAAAVVCDFVLPIFAVAEWQGIPYLVMQYSAGMNLQKRLDSEGPLKLNEILRISMQTARGLAAAHSQGLVHRDIKPSNILLDGSVERAMLTDFGLARAVDDASVTRTGLIAGTPLYMSPEQARGDKVETCSDIFSLGGTMYAMCTGHPPFRGETSYGVIRRIVDDQPRSIRQINPDIPSWLEGIVMRLLAKSPAERYTSAQEVADLLESCLAHAQQPTSSPLPKSLNQTSRSMKRWSPMFKFFAVAASLLFIAAGILISVELDKGTLSIECEVDDVPIRIIKGDKVVEKLTVSREGRRARVASGKYIVEIEQDFDKAIVADGTAVISRGGKDVVRIKDNSAPRLVTKVYEVGDLVDGESSESIEKGLRELIELIRESIDSDSWSRYINASINPFPANKSLVVHQTTETHEKIGVLLSSLRKLALDRPADDAAKKWLPKIEASGAFQRLLDAVASSSAEPNPTPVSMRLLRNYLEAGAGETDRIPKDVSTFVLPSIQNAVRSELKDGTIEYSFDVDLLKFFNEVGFLVTGQKNIGDEIIKGLLNDPTGPRIDAQRVVREQLGKRVKLTCDFRKQGPATFLIEIDVIDESALLQSLRRLLEFEPRYLANESKDFYVFSMPASEKDATPVRSAVTLVGKHLYIGSLEMVEQKRNINDEFKR